MSGKRGHRAERCADCGMGTGLCVCALIPRLAPRTTVVVVAHPWELDKPTNTGRFVARSLSGSRFLCTGDALPAPPPGAAVLFPSDEAEELRPGAAVSSLYVPDGTYRQARRMIRRQAVLAALPRVALPRESRAVGHIRRGVRLDLLSTYEAVARALGLLEGPDIEGPMLEFIEVVVKRTLWFRGKLAAVSVPGGISDAAHEAFGRPKRQS
ncbi:MAG: DTW domain-containing protein [Deltaproteobacteria bacterium]|nr:DTW domain-containing protein [Deltaproteobacteria bacterium]